MASEYNYKLIVALKFTIPAQQLKDLDLTCQLRMNDQTKMAQLPFVEGVFFDFNILSENTSLVIDIYQEGDRRSGMSIPIPELVNHNEETELSDQFEFECGETPLTGSYYLIMLNKNAFIQKNKKKVQFDGDKKAGKPKTKQVVSVPQKKSSKKVTNTPTPQKNSKAGLKERINEVTNKNLVAEQLTPKLSKSASTLEGDSHQVEYLKRLIYILDQRNEKQKQNDRINTLLKQELDAIDTKKEDLQHILNQAIENNDNELHKIKASHNQYLLEMNELSQAVRERNQEVSRLEAELNEVQQRNAENEEALMEYRRKDRAEEMQRKQIESMEEQIELYEKMVDADRSNHEALVDEKQKELDRLNEQLQNVIDHNEQLQDQVLQLQIEVTRTNLKSEKSEIQLEQLKHQSKEHKAQMESLTNQQTLHLKQLADFKAQNHEFAQALDQAKQQLSRLTSKKLDEDKLSCVAIDSLNRQSLEQQNQIASLKCLSSELKIRNQQLSAQVEHCRVVEALNKELQREVEQVKEKLYIIIDANDRINDQLEENQLQLQSANEEKLQKHTLIQEMEERLQQKEIEIMSHAQFQLDLTDPLDKKVAEYMRHQQAKYVFAKTPDGHYQYGTKKLMIKLEQDQALVRIGGGFVPIDEFVKLQQQKQGVRA